MRHQGELYTWKITLQQGEWPRGRVKPEFGELHLQPSLKAPLEFIPVCLTHHHNPTAEQV